MVRSNRFDAKSRRESLQISYVLAPLDVTDREAIRCTPVSVCGTAVESRCKLLPFSGSESLTMTPLCTRRQALVLC
jgi:hypothetical protein